MDDIEEVIRRAEHLRFEEDGSFTLLNRASNLPSSKKRMRASIVERIEALVCAYVSLASFVSDDDADFLIIQHGSKDKEILKKVSTIYQGVSDEMDRLKIEVRRKIKKI